MCSLIIVDQARQKHRIGSAKISQQGFMGGPNIVPGQRVLDLPAEFDQLGEKFFSFGQGEDYYEMLGRFASDVLIRGGVFWGLEVKTKTGRQSPDQKVFEEKVTKAGAPYHVVPSIVEVIALGFEPRVLQRLVA